MTAAAERAGFRLPVSGHSVGFHEPTGDDEMLLADARAHDLGLAIDVARRLISRADGAELDWNALTMTDLDAALLGLRQQVVGDRISTDTSCRRCHTRIDIDFRVSDFLAHHAPRRPRNVAAASEDGWFRLAGAEVTFRLPNCGDQRVLGTATSAEAELVRRCVDPPAIPGRVLQRIGRAVEMMAPMLFGVVHGRCPACDAETPLRFDPQRFVLVELSDDAVLVYDDVHVIASYYHWPESDILALPASRRRRYADMVRQATGNP